MTARSRPDHDAGLGDHVDHLDFVDHEGHRWSAADHLGRPVLLVFHRHLM